MEGTNQIINVENPIDFIHLATLITLSILPRKEGSMGQSMKKLATGRGDEEKKAKEIGPIIEQCYKKNLEETTTKEHTFGDFYHAICETVEEINKKFGNTQFQVPSSEALREAFDKFHKSEGGNVTKEEFKNILKEVVLHTGVMGTGAKDIIYIFGVPIVTLFIKQRLIPTAIPNEVFIPAVTSATVFVLAKLNKI